MVSIKNFSARDSRSIDWFASGDSFDVSGPPVRLAGDGPFPGERRLTDPGVVFQPLCSSAGGFEKSRCSSTATRFSRKRRDRPDESVVPHRHAYSLAYIIAGNPCQSKSFDRSSRDRLSPRFPGRLREHARKPAAPPVIDAGLRAGGPRSSFPAPEN